MYINEAFWDTPMVHSLCAFVMHELHPDEVCFWFYNEDKPINKKRAEQHGGREFYSTDLPRWAKFLVVIVLETVSNKHFTHYVFDLNNGLCDVMDPENTVKGSSERIEQEETHGKVSAL